MADEINEKIEQIKLKSEELEKKHQEAIQDELEAKKQGATLSKSQTVSCKTSEKKHRYDNIELDFDVKDEQKEHANKNPDYKPKSNRRPILGKKLDEIPPDPVNFLRDDGEITQDAQNKRTSQNNSNNNRYRNNNNRNNRPKDRGDNNEASNPEKSDSSGAQRQRNSNNYRPKSHHYQNNRSNAVAYDDSGNSPKKTHPQQLRNERRSADSKNVETSNNEVKQIQVPSQKPLQQPQEGRPKRSNNDTNIKPRPKPNREKNDEGKNDLTVEVTDEVRSVKLKSAEKTFGTGRVRPSTENYENLEGSNDKTKTEGSKKPNKGSNNHNKNYNRKPKPKAPQPEFQHPLLDKIVITKTSVQERLIRSQMMDDKDLQEMKIEPIASSAEVGDSQSNN